MYLLDTVLKVETEWLSGYRMVVSILVVDLHDGEANGAVARCPVQHHERGLCHMLFTWERIQIQNWKYGFC